jgi:hypothetical protein
LLLILAKPRACSVSSSVKWVKYKCGSEWHVKQSEVRKKKITVIFLMNLTQAKVYTPNLTHANIYQRMPRLPSRRTTSRSGRYVLLRQISDCHARGSAVDAWHANKHANINAH